MKTLRQFALRNSQPGGRRIARRRSAGPKAALPARRRSAGPKAALPARRRSAGLCPAVSQVFNLQGVRNAAGAFMQSNPPTAAGRSADCKSAIQQVENLRYSGWRYAFGGFVTNL
jgi:hypothetical protein